MIQLEKSAQPLRPSLPRLRRKSLNQDVLTEKLEKYLSKEQLDALEARRGLLIEHFDEQIARRDEGAVLYDLPPRRESTR